MNLDQQATTLDQSGPNMRHQIIPSEIVRDFVNRLEGTNDITLPRADALNRLLWQKL